MSHWYAVSSAEYSYVDVILDDGTGPIEYCRCFVYAKATNAKRAKIIALKWFRHNSSEWRNYCNEGNPFTGMLADLIPTNDYIYCR